ncbi:MAG: SpoIVB peptidase S55 domain-containing protein, partial [Isosphaeraceae bacterium]
MTIRAPLATLSVVIVTLGFFPMDSARIARAAEPDPSTYWKVEDLRPGMKGTGRTVMVGTKLEEFGAEVLGVMKGVSPGRDMVLCRLTGCNLEHAGIIQGMSGSPITIDGKLVGAVAFAWEFAKDPIAGVTPFEQMVSYVRSSDRRVAAEALEAGSHVSRAIPNGSVLLRDDPDVLAKARPPLPTPAGMKAIAMPVSASGFSPRALALLEQGLRPWNMAPVAGGAATADIIREEGDKPLVPGSPLGIAMVTGDFDVSGIGTVTHVEGDRVYGFGHPMLSLGACEFPMMTGYIHTVYPRASVSMKMGSPLKVVGVLDTDVSTCVAGWLGRKPDMIPMSVKVKSGRFSDPVTYHVEIVREPNLLASLVLSVLTNAIDTEGNLPEELTARMNAVVRLKDHAPIKFEDTLSGPRYTGVMGPAALFGPLGNIVNMLTRNPHERLRIEAIDCEVEIAEGRKVATVESIRLRSDRLESGEEL